ncbi:MAG TPA: DUF305 domain-containing protein [Actinomycetales bacterium]
MRIHRRPAHAVLAVATAALLGACGSDGGTEPAAAGTTGSGMTMTASADAAYNEQDVAFADDMKPHHEQAVAMADLVLAKDPSPQVAALATKIRAAQQPEIAELDSMIATFAADAGGAHGGEHGGGEHDGHDMSDDMGMMSEGDMAALEQAGGAEAERLFLEGMVAHHRGAVQMADAEIRDGRWDRAIALATSIKADQQAEIAEMTQLLAARS